MGGLGKILAWAGVMIALAATPAHAMELWRGAQLRLTHASVAKLFPGAKRPDAVNRVAGPDVGDLAAPVTLADHPAEARFYFAKDALWDVVVTVTDPSLDVAKAVAGQIDQDLGRKRHCETARDEGARHYDCVWPTAGNRLARLTYAEDPAGPPMLSIVFRPANRQSAIADAAADINASRTTVQDDAFSKNIEFYSPEDFRTPFGGDFTDVSLHSWMDRGSHSVGHLLRVSVTYIGGSQRRYDSAVDNSADELKVYKGDHSSTRCRSCNRSEDFSVALDADKLAGALTHPYQVKFSAQSGDSLIVTLDPAMVRGQLQAIAAHGGPPVPGEDQDVAPLALNMGATLETAAPKPNAPAGAKVKALSDDGVFAAAGVRTGDVITAVSGAAMDGAEAVQTAISALPPGQRVGLNVVRGGKPMTLQAQF